MCLIVDETAPEIEFDESGYASAWKVVERNSEGALWSPIYSLRWCKGEWHEAVGEPDFREGRFGNWICLYGCLYGGAIHCLRTLRAAKVSKMTRSAVIRVVFHRSDVIARNHDEVAVRRAYFAEVEEHE